MNAIGRTSQRAVWIAGASVGPAGNAAGTSRAASSVAGLWTSSTGRPYTDDELDGRGGPRHALGEVAEAGGDDRAGLRDQLLRDERLGGQQQRRHRRGVLEREPRDAH